MKPSSITSLETDGNTAHLTGWQWYHAAGFNFGGTLYTKDDGESLYNAGRDQANDSRSPCIPDLCANGNCDGWYRQEE